ncbi:MAG TPA: ImmA/IrrE family metallo-endopeptidase [Pyrinomonadaceae bacterium]
MTSVDFEAVCKREGITVERTRMKGDTRGLYFIQDGCSHIIIDTQLRGIRRVQVEFHELGHYFLRHERNKRALKQIDPDTHKYVKGSRSPLQEWLELEANIVACIAIAPGLMGADELRHLALTATRINWLKHK